MKKLLNRRIIISISISISILTYGIYKSKIFDSNGIIAKIPNDCTTPDFEVIFGSFKIGNLQLEKNTSVDKNYIWLDNYEILKNNENAQSPYYNHYYYIFEGNIIGYDSESRKKSAKIVNPKLRMESVEVIHEFTIYIYLIIAFVVIISNSYVCFIKEKTLNNSIES